MWFKNLLLSSVLALNALAATTTTPQERIYATINPDLAAVESAAATAIADISSSAVAGKVFDRFVVIWLENTDFDKAFANTDLASLAENGVLLDNYWALTHTSEPNYMAAAGGDYFGVGNDDFFSLPQNVSTIVDLLDTKGISWAEYQEHLPYPGFQGFNYSNQDTYANDYVRKHNPLVLYDSVISNETRLESIKTFDNFYQDLDNQELPQWMFITPNMTNDGHDTTIDYAGNWAKNFIEPLLTNEYFMNNTLVLLTFDEVETYPLQNKVWALLFGGAVDDSLKGTTDSTYYTHYSELSSVEANWDLPTLGRGDNNVDGDANVFEVIASQVGYTNLVKDTTNQYYNLSAPGYLSDETIPLPSPNCSATGVTGLGLLDSIKKIWCADSTVSNATSTTLTTVASSSATAKANASGNSSVSSVESANGAAALSIGGVLGLAAFLAAML